MEKNVVGTDIDQVKITSLSHIQGQPQVIGQLEVHLRAYFNIRSTSINSNPSFGPAILCGPSGAGKTMVAKALHAEFGNLKLIETNGETVNNKLELFAILIKQRRGLIQLCTTVDAWSPEAQEYNLGRKCLEAILAEPNWTVRILTKNAAIKKDFHLIEIYKNRVLVGLSITATSDKSDIIKIIEPNASPIEERIEVLKEARARGFRTYAMFCPMLPGIADSPNQINEFIKLSVDLGVEEVFAEAVNPRGRGLILTQDALKSKGYDYEAARIESIRNRKNWSRYVTQLIKNIQKSIRQQYDICKLRFLLYPSKLELQDLARIKQDDAGVIWLGKS